VIVGVNREGSEQAFRQEVDQRLREHLTERTP
jgi:hypothetical protein